MATVNGIYPFLRDVTGLGNDAIEIARANAIIEEGLTDVEDLHELHQANYVSRAK